MKHDQLHSLNCIKWLNGLGSIWNRPIVFKAKKENILATRKFFPPQKYGGLLKSVALFGQTEHAYRPALGLRLAVPRSTQPCILSRSLNWVGAASAGVRAGMSPLPDDR